MIHKILQILNLSPISNETKSDILSKDILIAITQLEEAINKTEESKKSPIIEKKKYDYDDLEQIIDYVLEISKKLIWSIIRYLFFGSQQKHKNKLFQNQQRNCDFISKKCECCTCYLYQNSQYNCTYFCWRYNDNFLRSKRIHGFNIMS